VPASTSMAASRRPGSATPGVNSYWNARLGPFDDDDTVRYVIEGQSPAGASRTGEFIVSVGAALYVALLWHQHQPLHRDVGAGRGARRLRLPWVRLHALRDYYGIAAIAAAHDVRVTINLTPGLDRRLHRRSHRSAARPVPAPRRSPERQGGRGAVVDGLRCRLAPADPAPPPLPGAVRGARSSSGSRARNPDAAGLLLSARTRATSHDHHVDRSKPSGEFPGIRGIVPFPCTNRPARRLWTLYPRKGYPRMRRGVRLAGCARRPCSEAHRDELPAH